MQITIPPSYVIFVWYLLFIIGVVPYNPFWWLVISFIAVVFMILQMIYYRNDFLMITLFILINTIIKVIPIYHLQSQYNKTIHWETDFLPGLILMILYVAWETNGTFSFEIIEKRMNKIQYNIQHNKPVSPIIKYIYRHYKQSITSLL